MGKHKFLTLNLWLQAPIGCTISPIFILLHLQIKLIFYFPNQELQNFHSLFNISELLPSHSYLSLRNEKLLKWNIFLFLILKSINLHVCVYVFFPFFSLLYPPKGTFSIQQGASSDLYWIPFHLASSKPRSADFYCRGPGSKTFRLHGQ